MTSKISLLLFSLFLLGCGNADQNPSTDNTDTATASTNAIDVESEPEEPLISEAEQPAVTAIDSITEPQEVTEHIELTDDWEPDYDDFYEGREFMIILSSKDLEKAKEYATKAATTLGLRLLIDGLEEVDGHLSFTKTDCEEGGFDYPCYVARGRWDDGDYVSIEQSDAYDGFTRGYYIVVVSSGPTGEVPRRAFLETVHEHYPDAYIKKTQVYTGCIH